MPRLLPLRAGLINPLCRAVAGGTFPRAARRVNKREGSTKCEREQERKAELGGSEGMGWREREKDVLSERGGVGMWLDSVILKVFKLQEGRLRFDERRKFFAQRAVRSWQCCPELRLLPQGHGWDPELLGGTQPMAGLGTGWAVRPLAAQTFCDSTILCGCRLSSLSHPTPGKLSFIILAVILYFFFLHPLLAKSKLLSTTPSLSQALKDLHCPSQ